MYTLYSERDSIYHYPDKYAHPCQYTDTPVRLPALHSHQE